MNTNHLDFVCYKHNEIQFDDHRVIYNFLRQKGRKYYQSATIEVDGTKYKENYTKEEEESCFYTFYEAYERLCRKHNIVPAQIDFFGIEDMWEHD